MSEQTQKMTSISRVMEAGGGLKHSMKTKDAVMVGVGGTIGTGLFLSSGYVLQNAGPGGAIVSYLIGGFIIWLMIQCLGELASAMPVSGSMQAYATEFINPAMGFTVGWVNWLGGALTITAQIVASAIIMGNIIPSVPTVIWVVLFTLLLFGVNIINVRQFGNASFWIASLKLVLVVVFVIVGLGMIFGLVGGEAAGFSNYTKNGGFFPLGIGGIIAVFFSAFYAFGGTETIAAAAGEIENTKEIPKAVNSTIAILVSVYIVCMLILIALLPWQQADLEGSPFAYVFKNAGLTGAELIVNIIVLTSALTSGNYFVYACTRYLWSLSKFGQAPKFCAKTTQKGVPVYALIVSMLFAAFAIVAQFVAESTVYFFLILLIGGVNIFIYTIVCICQYNFRKRYIAEGGNLNELRYRVLSYPAVPILGILCFVAVLIATVLDPSQATAIYICVPSYLILYIAFHLYTKKKKNARAANIDM